MNTAPTALVADDEPFMREALVDALASTWPGLQLLGRAADGPEAFRQLQALRPDIAFLDVRMPGMTGLQVAEALGAAAPRVVFVTAHEDHALQAFEAGAVDYVLKPIELPRLARTVARLQQRLQAPGGGDGAALLQTLERLRAAAPAAPQRLEWIRASRGAQVRLIHVDDVHFFESDAKYTRVVTADGEALIRVPLKELLDGLDPKWFWQIHRGTIVNARRVDGVRRDGDSMVVLLKGLAATLKVSPPYQPLFRQM